MAIKKPGTQPVNISNGYENGDKRVNIRYPRIDSQIGSMSMSSEI